MSEGLPTEPFTPRPETFGERGDAILSKLCEKRYPALGHDPEWRESSQRRLHDLQSVDEESGE